MTESAFQTLNRLLCSYRDGSLDTQTFCHAFEQAFNFDVDRASLSEREEEIFNGIFNEVVLFSPFPNELKLYPRYRSDAQINAAAKVARQRLDPQENSH